MHMMSQQVEITVLIPTECQNDGVSVLAFSLDATNIPRKQQRGVVYGCCNCAIDCANRYNMKLELTFYILLKTKENGSLQSAAATGI